MCDDTFLSIGTALLVISVSSIAHRLFTFRIKYYFEQEDPVDE